MTDKLTFDGEKLIIEGEWACWEQEGGFADPAAVVGEHELSGVIDAFLGLRTEDGESGIVIRITVERIGEKP